MREPLAQRFTWVATAAIALAFIATTAEAKIHHLSLRSDSRRNIILTSFGFAAEGSFDLRLTDLAVPEKIATVSDKTDLAKKRGVIGFSLSRGLNIAGGVGNNPHVCQLDQKDQGYDALFFLLDLPNNRMNVYRSGIGLNITLCPDHQTCALGGLDALVDSVVPPPPPVTEVKEEVKKVEKAVGEGGEKKKRETGAPVREKRGVGEFLKKLFTGGGVGEGTAYKDYVPLEKTADSYAANISIRFPASLVGRYHLIYHNCYNYHESGYSDRVAVDFTVDVVERNVGSYLSAGDIPKPQLYLYISLMFTLAAALWSRKICLADSQNVYRVHRLMTALVILKALSMFFHGVNFYFVSKYGQQREFWAVVFYITHLIKGALLFGTIVLIGTGYTFFKNFLTERDRKVFMVVVPLQIVDNMAMIVIEESEFGQQSYQLWFELFVFLDMICCFFVFFPIIWSMHHLADGARSDGKAAFNLEKLRLFRHFYMIVICYIYLTRIIKFFLMYSMPFSLEWICDAIVELSTLFFFVLVGKKFQPQARNPYLKLDQDEEGDMALTQNGIFEGVTNRTGNKEERIYMDEIPGAIGGADSDDSDEDREGEDDVLLPLHPERTLL